MKKCLLLLSSVLFLLPAIAHAQGAQEARLGYVNLGTGWQPWNAIQIGGTAPGYALEGVRLYCQSGSTIAPCNPAAGAPVNAALMPHLIACTAKVKINAGSCRVNAIGDSTTFGEFSTGPANTGDLVSGSYPARLSQYLNSAILPSQHDSFMGAGQSSAGNSALFNDARIVSTGWTGASVTTGGNLFTAASTANLAFTPTGQVNQFTLWWAVVGANNGTFSWAVDAGTPTNITENGTNGVFSTVIPAGTLGTHVLHLNWVSGVVFFVGVEAVNTAVGSVNIISAGNPGASSTAWNNATAAWSPIPAVVAQAPDVILLDLGINDWLQSVPVATFTSNMQTLINAWKANSDIVLITPAPSSIPDAPLAKQQQYVAATYALAAANNLPIVDNFGRWGSFELKNPAPYLFYGNHLHPNANGYSDFAQSIAAQLLSVVGH